MKKLFFILLVSALCGCNSEKKDDESDASKNMPGIQNVNGNLPDTTNAINLDKNKSDSTISKDSVDKK